MEENRIGVAAIIVEDPESVREVNDVLHDHSGIIIGRMGIPYRERNVSVISLVLDASPDEISARVGDVLAMRHIEALRNRLISTLSQGELERVAIAAAVATLSESVPRLIGMCARTSQRRIVSSVKPGPSAPTRMATR